MRILVKNKKIYLDYEITDTVDAGIVLVGHEVKALKLQGGNLRDAIVKINEKEIWLVNLDIPIYKRVSWNTLGEYNPKGRRKLLITQKQLTRLRERTQKTGLHIVPTQIYEDKNRRIKVTIGLAKRKRNIQKKQSIKDKDTKRQMDREVKAYKNS